MTTPADPQLRRDYAGPELLESAVNPDPLRQFEAWFEEAIRAVANEPNAMTLATVAPDGRPQARVVLLKDVDERGFAFFTNYESSKADALRANPRACLNFWWPELARQVRIEGAVERVAESESDAYFATRPRDAQIGAWASPQSRPLPERAALESRAAELRAQFRGRDVPRPPHWGGFRVAPDRIEFWQGRLNRLHDRLVYERVGAAWKLERIAP